MSESGSASLQMPPDLAAETRRIGSLIAEKRGAEAKAASDQLVANAPAFPQVWLTHARACQLNGALTDMREAVSAAFALAPEARIGFMLVEACLMLGDSKRALAVLAEIEGGAAGDYATLRRLTDLYTQCLVFDGAARTARAAAAIKPNDPDTLFNVAPSAIALGELDEAEAALDRVIALNRNDWEAYYLRATVRKQNADDNHVSALKEALTRGRGDPKAETALGYALGKELEDLGQLDEAFDYLAIGAAARRQRMSYTVDIDERAMADVADAFNAGYLNRPSAGHDGEAPIFIVGMPRSGTTLVDRILSSHSCVASRGELNDLPMAITQATPRATDKSSRIAASTQIDARALGEAYARSLRGWGDGPARLIDKAPLNFLYIGLIVKALPNARIIHVTRHPMASGFAMFKTYFRMGYPFSYDLNEIGRYIAAYRKLLTHWRTHLPGRILDVAYEDVVDDIEAQARRMLDHCALAWEPACVAFHHNASPSATASAAQVRQPLYRGSLDQWRKIEHRLQPLAESLKARGVALS